MRPFTILLFSFIIFIGNSSFCLLSGYSKLTKEGGSGLEGIIVEKYYTSKAKDSADTSGGLLPKGSVTYRIYVDMEPGYTLQAVYGVPKHELIIKTTTSFFNNKTCKARTGDKINEAKVNENSVSLDSWLSIGAATESHFGVLKNEDTDGSILTRDFFKKSDGLLAGTIPKLVLFGIDLDSFGLQNNTSTFSTDNGSIAVLGGMKGPTNENKVLIAQLTTTGKLSFELNLQLGTPHGGTIRYVAKNPESGEVQFDGLTLK